MQPIYLDYNATTPIDPIVAEAMMPYLTTHFGNPSSSHYYGKITHDAVEKSRRQIANLLNCTTEELIFTSGGTESNNYAIKGVARAYKNKGNHIISSNVEHPAVTEVCDFLQKEGFEITYLPVDRDGLISLRQVEKVIRPSTILITIMHANNEVGTIMPIKEISEIAHRHNIFVHSDCAQSVGKIEVTADSLGVDLLSIAGHKLYAPKGIGALYVKKGINLEKQIHGAGHESGRRAGTENILEIVGLGKAAELISNNLDEYSYHMKKMRDLLEKSLFDKIPDLKINGHPEKRLPNTASVSFKNREANKMLSQLKGIAASAGAACHGDGVDISNVIKAMNIPLEYAKGTLRFSVGRHTSEEEINRAVAEIVGIYG